MSNRWSKLTSYSHADIKQLTRSYQHTKRLVEALVAVFVWLVATPQFDNDECYHFPLSIRGSMSLEFSRTDGENTLFCSILIRQTTFFLGV